MRTFGQSSYVDSTTLWARRAAVRRLPGALAAVAPRPETTCRGEPIGGLGGEGVEPSVRRERPAVREQCLADAPAAALSADQTEIAPCPRPGGAIRPPRASNGTPPGAATTASSPATASPAASRWGAATSMTGKTGMTGNAPIARRSRRSSGQKSAAIALGYQALPLASWRHSWNNTTDLAEDGRSGEAIGAVLQEGTGAGR